MATVLFYLPTYLPTYLSACLPACLPAYLPACLPACLSVCLSICLSICLSVYLSVYLYLPMPTCLWLLSVPTVCAYCLCLPSVPTVCAYCLYLPVYAYLSVIWAKGRPDRRLCLIRLIVLIQIVLYGRSLAVHSNGGRLGCLPRRPWFDSAMGRYRSSGSIRSIDWLNRSSRSLAGCSNGGRLVLATVLCWLPF
jgi:hypothetical protein